MNRLKQKPIKQLKTHFMPFPHESPRAETAEDGSEIHKFRFAYPRGTLDARMSAKELADFVVNQMLGILSMRLLDFTDFVCRCGWRSRLQPQDTICPLCNHKCTTVNRTDVQEAFRELLFKFVIAREVLVEVKEESLGILVKPRFQRVIQYQLRGTLDELLPWVKVTRAGTQSPIIGQPMDDNDYIELNLHDKKPFADRKLVFDYGGSA